MSLVEGPEPWGMSFIESIWLLASYAQAKTGTELRQPKMARDLCTWRGPTGGQKSRTA